MSIMLNLRDDQGAMRPPLHLRDYLKDHPMIAMLHETVMIGITTLHHWSCPAEPRG
jgi:hypothetical protein